MTHLLAASVDLHEVAILLDVDGTLLDLAATPREVFVPPSLRETLAVLLDKTGGALALVSGRPLSDLDMIFAPLQLPAVGGHGAEIRVAAGGQADRGRAAPLSDEVKRLFATVAAASPGILVEDKGYSIALHYRLAPDMEQHVHNAVLQISERLSDRFEVLPGKAVIEIKLAGFDKGTAVRDAHGVPSVCRAPSRVHRRRHDRRGRLRGSSRVQWSRDLGRSPDPGRCHVLRRSTGRPHVAGANLPGGSSPRGMT